eukprot:CAMPEP_0170566970 /NCGR_PEP_ID=MMETSP0211-20121228/80182_1 /TAXON_ID=311385 /ORGANISM="Pseudokeronopsis sp., Strain OXSARD2" /LENGTH=104 /DNA_ID=CAMNT_0010888297 /DNA_START=388 /DNA_END=702 /DNA_ORIENTATION=-
MIEDDPKEFINFQIDVCSKQKSKTYKTQAGKLLEHLVDNMEGMISFVTQFSFEVYDVTVDQEKGLEGSSFLLPLFEKFKLNFFSKEDYLDTALLILSIISYQVC